MCREVLAFRREYVISGCEWVLVYWVDFIHSNMRHGVGSVFASTVM